MSAAALEGDLRNFFPTEILQLLQLAQSTGRLELRRGGELAEVWLEGGRPVFARTSGGAVRTGEILLHRGQITRTLLDEALVAQRSRPGERIGGLLERRGASAEHVAQAVHESVRRVLYGVLLWREGTFRFLGGEQLADNDLPLDVDLDRLILEGLRLADQERRRTG